MTGNHSLLCIFAKAPQPGYVKTRLAAAIGEQAAARLHSALVRRCLQATAAFPGQRQLWCHPHSRHDFFKSCQRQYRVTLKDQVGGDLGEIMLHALGDGLRRHDKVILIGSDCPTLNMPYLDLAMDALDRVPVVMGPAEDGGYVLMAASRQLHKAHAALIPVLFERIPWGGDQVMAISRQRLAAGHIAWLELPVLADLDRPADLQRFHGEIASFL